MWGRKNAEENEVDVAAQFETNLEELKGRVQAADTGVVFTEVTVRTDFARVDPRTFSSFPV
jgi:hypothetical protein